MGGKAKPRMNPTAIRMRCILIFLAFSLIFAFIPSFSFAQTIPPGRRAGEDPPWTLEQVQALYPDYDCVADVVAGHWLVLSSVPGSGYTGWHVAEYQLYAGDIVVYLGAELVGDRVPSGPTVQFGFSDVRSPVTGQITGDIRKLRYIGDAYLVSEDIRVYGQVQSFYMSVDVVNQSLPLLAWAPEAAIAICSPLPPTATPTLTPSPTSSLPPAPNIPFWRLIDDFVVSSPGSVQYPAYEQYIVELERVPPLSSGQSRFFVNGVYYGFVGSGGSCFSFTNAASFLFDNSSLAPITLSWSGLDPNPWCGGRTEMTPTRVRVYVPGGYSSIPRFSTGSPPDGYYFVGAWRGVGNFTFPTSSYPSVMVVFRNHPDDALGSGSRVLSGASQFDPGNGGQCGGGYTSGSWTFSPPGSDLRIRSRGCRMMVIEFEIWASVPVAPTDAPTGTPTLTPTVTPTSTPTPRPTRTLRPTRTATPTFGVGQCPSYQIAGSRDLVLTGSWLLYSGDSPRVSVVRVNGVDVTPAPLPRWGSSDPAFALVPGDGGFARVRLSVASGTGVAYFCESPGLVPSPTVFGTPTQTRTPTPTGSPTVTPSPEVDSACMVEPCTSLAVASRVFNDLAALDWSYPADCRAHIATVLPVAPTASSVVRMAGGVDVRASAEGFCTVVEVTEPWRDLVRYGLTFAIVGLVLVNVLIRRYRGLAGESNG